MKKLVSAVILLCVANVAMAAPQPIDALKQMEKAYATKSIELQSSLFTDDYRFHSLVMKLSEYVDGSDREREIRIAKNLFAGRLFGKGEPKPDAMRLELVCGDVTEGPDPEHADSTEHYRVLVSNKFSMRVIEDGKERMSVPSSQHVFHVVRGDAAVLASGQKADAGKWYIRRWLENTSGVQTALADSKGDCGEGATAGAKLTPGPGALAVRALNNPACPALEVMCDVPGTEALHVDVFDVTGRLANQREIAVKNAGALKVEAGAGANLTPGVYWVRLRQAKLKPSTRMVVVAK